jgi:hypothetical protein
MTQAFNLSQFANKVNTSGQADLTTAVSGTLPVANGGTGVTSAGASGNILTSNGTAWVSSTPAGGGVTSLNGQTGAITNTTSGAIGSYFIGGLQNTAIAQGGTIAGSSIKSPGFAYDGPIQQFFQTSSNPGLSGTWRAMMACPSSTGAGWPATYLMNNLFVRIS